MRAQALAGVMYRFGAGVLWDNAKAAYWLEKAAAQEFPWAQYHLAELLYHAPGLEYDYERAFALYKAAAEAGEKEAMHALSGMYRDGKGTARDREKADFWRAQAREPVETGKFVIAGGVVALLVLILLWRLWNLQYRRTPRL